MGGGGGFVGGAMLIPVALFSNRAFQRGRTHKPLSTHSTPKWPTTDDPVFWEQLIMPGFLSLVLGARFAPQTFVLASRRACLCVRVCDEACGQTMVNSNVGATARSAHNASIPKRNNLEAASFSP